MAIDRAFILIKPDAVARGLTGEILRRFEERGLELCALRMTQGSEAQFRAMYEDKADEIFFEDLLQFLMSGPVVPAVFAGENASERVRQVLGHKDPLMSEPGSIRGGLPATDRVHTLCHGSRNAVEGENELALWYPELAIETNTPAAAMPAGDAPYAPTELSALGPDTLWEGRMEPLPSEAAGVKTWPGLEEVYASKW